MKIKEVKIVVGSNYGDECKGLATHYFAQKASKRYVKVSEGQKRHEKVLNVLYNGGCQRGHTVELKTGERHVFHHFGSGTFDHADTYFDLDFMVNPIFFNEEFFELRDQFGIPPVSYTHPSCRFVTPYDMILNQIIEERRGSDRHGSCGYGIFETRKRYELKGRELMKYATPVMGFHNMSDAEKFKYLDRIRKEYVPKRLKDIGIVLHEDSKWLEILQDDGIIIQYIKDFKLMMELTALTTSIELFPNYDTLIFEGGQGLALDEDNMKDYPHLTPSHTGSSVPLERLLTSGADVDWGNIEICYVTRSYFTRHGAGNFPTECKKEEINENIVDKTNVYNDFQESIRYGRFDKKSFIKRTFDDYSKSYKVFRDIAVIEDYKEDFGVTPSLFVSHLNYTEGDIYGNTSLKDLSKYFTRMYISDTKYSEDVKHTYGTEYLE